MKILLIDNYDSFTYNLYHLIQSKVSDIDVIRNDKIELKRLINTIKFSYHQVGLPSTVDKQLIKNTVKKKVFLVFILDVKL